MEDDAIDKNTLLNWLSSAQGSIATPHSQRSFAYIHMQMQGHTLGYISDLITEFEAVIATAVQTAVKREDVAPRPFPSKAEEMKNPPNALKLGNALYTTSSMGYGGTQPKAQD